MSVANQGLGRPLQSTWMWELSLGSPAMMLYRPIMPWAVKEASDVIWPWWWWPAVLNLYPTFLAYQSPSILAQ